MPHIYAHVHAYAMGTHVHIDIVKVSPLSVKDLALYPGYSEILLG